MQRESARSGADGLDGRGELEVFDAEGLAPSGGAFPSKRRPPLAANVLKAGFAPRASSFGKTLAGLRLPLRPPGRGAPPWAPAGLGSPEASPRVLPCGPASGGPNGQGPSLDFARRANSVRFIRLPAEWSLPASWSWLAQRQVCRKQIGVAPLVLGAGAARCAAQRELAPGGNPHSASHRAAQRHAAVPSRAAREAVSYGC
jgi:hypothetical protein